LAFFAGLTAVLAKVGVAHVNSNLATAIRTVVILIFAWSVALFTSSQPISTICGRTWVFLILSGVGPLKANSRYGCELTSRSR
jgi:transporter family protein